MCCALCFRTVHVSRGILPYIFLVQGKKVMFFSIQLLRVKIIERVRRVPHIPHFFFIAVINFY